MTQSSKGFPCGTSHVVKNPSAKAGDLRDVGFIPGSGRSLEEGMATHLPEESYVQRGLEGYSPWGYKE